MIGDSFEIDGQEIDIHILDNKNENCFLIFAQNRNGDFLNGFEFRVKKINNQDLNTFSQSVPAFAIISFMRRQIEEKHWQLYETDGHDIALSTAATESAPRQAGREAFLNKQHYCHNPYSGLDRFTHEEWDRGWAEAAQKNPEFFDFSIDSFEDNYV